MSNTIILKNSSVASKVPNPSDLSLGELAINTTDGKMFTKKGDGTVVEVGSGAPAILDFNTSVSNVYPTIGVETLTNKRHPVTDKPIYTQAWDGLTPNPSNDFTVNTGLTGIDKCWVQRFTIDNNNSETVTGNSNWDISDTSQIYIQASTDGTYTNVILPDNSSFYNNAPYIIILEYTKTLDTSSGPIAGPQSGDILQKVAVDNPFATSTAMTIGLLINEINITPRSTNSTFMITITMPYRIDFDPDEAFAISVYTDDVRTPDKAIGTSFTSSGTIISSLTTALMLSNTTSSVKNIKVKVSSVSNSPLVNALYPNMLIIEEVQN